MLQELNHKWLLASKVDLQILKFLRNKKIRFDHSPSRSLTFKPILRNNFPQKFPEMNQFYCDMFFLAC